MCNNRRCDSLLLFNKEDVTLSFAVWNVTTITSSLCVTDLARSLISSGFAALTTWKSFVGIMSGKCNVYHPTLATLDSAWILSKFFLFFGWNENIVCSPICLASTLKHGILFFNQTSDMNSLKPFDKLQKPFTHLTKFYHGEDFTHSDNFVRILPIMLLDTWVTISDGGGEKRLILDIMSELPQRIKLQQRHSCRLRLFWINSKTFSKHESTSEDINISPSFNETSTVLTIFNQ